MDYPAECDRVHWRGSASAITYIRRSTAASLAVYS